MIVRSDARLCVPHLRLGILKKATRNVGGEPWCLSCFRGNEAATLREIKRDTSLRWAQENRERHNAIERSNYRRHRLEILKRQQMYYQENQDLLLLKKQVRRGRLKRVSA